MTGRRLRIAIACHPTYGGSGVVATELGMALAARGHEVHFVSYAAPHRMRDLQEKVAYHEVEITDYPLFRYPPYDLALAAKLADVAATCAIDVIHAHYAIPHSVSAYLTREILGERNGPKVVTTLHGTDITLVGSERAFWAVTKFGIESSDAVTAVSTYLARETEAIFRTRRPIHVIPNFVETGWYAPERRRPTLRQRFAPEDEALLVHLSNFRPVKRVEDVVRIFFRVQRERPARLLLVGYGPERRRAEELVRELGISARVAFLGAVDGVAEILSIGDLFLLPSAGESFGLAALEAMSCGLPVIAARAGGIGEVVVDGQTGVLCDVGDCRAMAEAALGILGDPERLEAMGRAARQRAIETFPQDRIVRRYEALYLETLGEGAAPADGDP